MMNTTEKEELAKSYATRGYPVFPVKNDASKAPLTNHGWKDATIDLDQLTKWWKQWPSAQVGVSTDGAGLAVVDLDVKRGQRGPDNWAERFAELVPEPVWVVITPSGGQHLWYRNDGQWRNSQDPKTGIDIRAKGGYVVAYGPPPDVELPVLPFVPDVQKKEAIALVMATSDVEIVDDFPYTWKEIMAQGNWDQCTGGDNFGYWARPGKYCSEGHSASVSDEYAYAITVFSGEGLLVEGAYSKERAYTLLWHDGDADKAQAALKKLRARKLTVRKASDYTIKRTRWIWDQRIALGTLALLGGREGIGKSTLSYRLAADVTNGNMPGIYAGQKRGVIIVAKEDSWEHTIVPRLVAAGADLDLVYNVLAIDGEHGLSLPDDIWELSATIEKTDTALVILDPLISQLDGKIDTHKDHDVRQALEPLVKMAEESGAAVLGLIHVNKSGDTNALNTLMGSRAFPAVARSVLYVVEDPDDKDIKVMGQPKNNLGKSGLPELTFAIEGVKVHEDEEGPIFSSRLTWKGEVNGQVDHILAKANQPSKNYAARMWLEQYLLQHGKSPKPEVMDAGKKAGHAETTLQRAFNESGAEKEQGSLPGKPNVTFWFMPGRDLIEI